MEFGPQIDNLLARLYAQGAAQNELLEPSKRVLHSFDGGLEFTVRVG